MVSLAEKRSWRRGSAGQTTLLYVGKRVVGVIEAKPVGTPLSGVEWQSAKYAEGLPAEVRRRALTVDGRLPFIFEASGSETHVTNGYDPVPRARRIFAFPRPETLARTLCKAKTDPDAATWRGKVRAMPELLVEGLRPAQIEATTEIERSLAGQRFGRSLVQMATGAGKTFTTVTESYRSSSTAGSDESCAWSTATTSAIRHCVSSRTTPRPTTTGASPSSTTSTNSPAPGWWTPPISSSPPSSACTPHYTGNRCLMSTTRALTGSSPMRRSR